MLSLIAAVGKNGELGKNGRMPWHLPEDLRYFKETTLGHTLIMGKNTFYSLPGILPGRMHIVLSSTMEEGVGDNIILCRNFRELLAEHEKSPGEVFVSGGAKIYGLFLPYCEKLYLTRINREFDADTHMPPIDFSLYTLLSSTETKTDPKTGIEFCFQVYKKR